MVEPDTGLTTVVKLTKASGPENSDASVGVDLVTTDVTLADRQDQDVEVLGDSAYATGDMLDRLDEKSWTPLLKPWPIKPAVEGGFTIDDFIPDTTAGTLTCPAGVTRNITAKRTVTFGAVCRDCPLVERCTTSARGRKVTLHEHDQLMREHRKRAAGEGFHSVYRQHRPMVERSIAWLVRGNRRVPYRGIDKNNSWLHHRVAALNLRRLHAMGLTVQDGAWVLA